MEARRIDILNKVKSGAISIEEGAQKLSSLEEEAAASSTLSEPTIELAPPAVVPTAPAHETAPVLHEATPQDVAEENLDSFRNWWLIPLWIGLGVTVFAAGLMSWGYSNRFFFWFSCAWLPLLLGLVILVGAFWSRTARWLHIRVHENREHHATHIRLSFPIPIRLAGWALRFASPYIPQMKDQDWVETVIPVLETLENSREPMVVEVNEEDGQKVQVYFL